MCTCSRRPVGWTIPPTEEATGRSLCGLLSYALGEVRRIPAYAAADKGFCTMPADFPQDLVASLCALEPAIQAAVQMEADHKARSQAGTPPAAQSA